jgi:hypothetical protein
MTPEQKKLEQLEHLAGQMDAAFRLPGTKIRIGYDSIVGLIPGIGDTLAVLPAAYIINESRRMGMSNTVLARMITNAGVDYVIGLVPLLGDVFDVGFKANRRNVAILREELGRRGLVTQEKGADTSPPRDPRFGSRRIEA